MTQPGSASTPRTPEQWEAAALAERTKDLPPVRRDLALGAGVNPWMVILTLVWLLLGIISATLSSSEVVSDDDPNPLRFLVAAGVVALAQVVVLAVRWEPRP